MENIVKIYNKKKLIKTVEYPEWVHYNDIRRDMQEKKLLTAGTTHANIEYRDKHIIVTKGE